METEVLKPSAIRRIGLHLCSNDGEQIVAESTIGSPKVPTLLPEAVAGDGEGAEWQSEALATMAL